MAKKIRREVMSSGNTEQEYAEWLMAALAGSTIHDMQFAQQKHNFGTYAKKRFEVFSKPAVSQGRP